MTNKFNYEIWLFFFTQKHSRRFHVHVFVLLTVVLWVWPAQCFSPSKRGAQGEDHAGAARDGGRQHREGEQHDGGEAGEDPGGPCGKGVPHGDCYICSRKYLKDLYVCQVVTPFHMNTFTH